MKLSNISVIFIIIVLPIILLLSYYISLQIDTINNEYDERKGRRDGFTLKLEGLSRYDMWYYGDILTSSKVRVSFDGTTWRQVQVTGKAIKLPMSDEGALNVLEIPVNYRHYDTL